MRSFLWMEYLKNRNEFKNDLNKLSQNARILKELRFIINECLTTGAYSSKNETEQMQKLDKLNTPKWEIDILNNLYTMERKFSHKTLKDLNSFMIKYKDIIDSA